MWKFQTSKFSESEFKKFKLLEIIIKNKSLEKMQTSLLNHVTTEG